MCRITWVWIIAILLAANIALAQTITLREEVSVKGWSLFLADVAEIEGNRQWQQFCLGKTPALGQTCYLDRDAIAQKLKRLGLDVTTIVWQGSADVAITTAVTNIPADELVTAARDFLTTALPWAAEDVELSLMSEPRTLDVPSPRFTLVVSPRFAGQPQYRGRISVEVAILVDGQQAKRTSVAFYARVCQPVFVTRRLIARHSPITSSDLQTQRLEISSFARLPITNLGDLSGKQTTGTLPANHILTPLDVEAAPLIRRGAGITIGFEMGGLKITIPGKALDHGGLGEIIRVLNLASNKIIQAKVTSDTTVALLSGE